MGAPGKSFSSESVATGRRRREAISAFIRVLSSPTTGPYGRLVGSSSGVGSMTPSRPGTGGRRTRVDAGFRTEATRELRERFGEPLQLREAGVTLEAWPVDPDGDGIVGVRLSSRDVQQGETAFGQVHACLELCERHTIKPSWVVVTCHCSGAMDFDDRPDFRFFRERILEGGIRWMAWRHTDRIARHQLPAELFYRLLEENDVSLYLAHVGRKMDWLRDRAFLLTFGMVGEMERQLIKDRTHSAIIRRYLEPGRGYPTAKKVGFRRAADKYLEVDPDQWPYIERVHHDYATLFDNGTTSLRKLAEHMRDLGFPLSHQKLKDVLTDRIYVDGVWSSEYDGTVYPCRPIPLPSPIPAEVFERNQLLLSTRRGSNRKTPPGHFLLQGVQVTHVRCADFVDERGVSPRLTGRRNYRLSPDHDPGVYGHTYTPSCCEGCQPIHAPALERVVIEQVLRLAEDPELQAAWAHNAALKSGATAALGVLGHEQRAMMEVKIRNLERQRDRHEREWLDALADGAQLPVDHLARVTSGLDQEIERYRNHLEVDDRVRRERDAAGAQRSELLGRLREVLTFEPPSDPDLRIRRNWAIRAIVSEVIVDDRDGGLLVELRGPLVPAGRLFRPANPARDAAESANGSARKPSSNPTIGGRFSHPETVPSWISDPVRVEVLTWEQAVDAIRRADAVLPPGLITSEAWEGARRVTTLPAWRWVVAAADKRGGMAHLIRAALLAAVRVAHQRLTPLDHEELTFVMADAVGRGFEMGCASQRWRASDPASPRLCPKTLQRHAVLAGTSALELYVAAGGTAPPAPLPPLYPRRPKGRLPESVRRERERRREAARRDDVARHLENYLALEDRWPPSAKWKRDGMYALHQRALRYATRDEWCADLGLLPPATERVDRQTDEYMEAELRALLRELKPDVWPRLAVIAFRCGPGFTNRLIARTSAKDLAARFGLPRAPDRSRRAQIEAGLVALVERLGRWPTRKDFEKEQLMLVYFDVQYGGGTTWWRARLRDMGYDV